VQVRAQVKEYEWKGAEKWSDRMWESVPPEHAGCVCNSGNDVCITREGGKSWTTVSGKDIELKYWYFHKY